jgi:hypothetical protein
MSSEAVPQTAGNRRVGVVLVLVIASVTAFAQQMPDPSQMAGVPLPAPELPNGTVVVRLMRETIGNNIVGHAVQVIAAGKELPGTTGQDGRAQFTGLAPGAAVVATAIVDGETLRSREFTVPERGGVRVALIAGIAAAAARDKAARDAAAKEPARRGIVVFGGESRIILEFQDDNLQVFYLLDVMNAARTPIDTGAPLELVLPDAAAGAALMEGSSTRATVRGDRVLITGPFPPGKTSVQLGYRLAYSGDSVQLKQTWPAVMDELFVAMEKVGQVKVASPQFTAQQEAQASGQPFIMATGGRLNAGDTLTLDLTGLPHRSTTLRNIAIVLGAVILVAGIWAGVAAPRIKANRTVALEAKREKLFGELVHLEEQQRSGHLGEAKYQARRQSLVSQLERVLADLERAGGGEEFAA